MKRLITIATALAATIGLGVTVTATDTKPVDPGERGQIATFEGTAFDMSQGWGLADVRPEVQACHIENETANCYRSEREMDEATGEPPSQRAASCSSSLRLYDGTYKTGAVLSLTTRGATLGLSTYGFNNRTSSYRVGACSSKLYSGFQSGLYGGNTSSYASTNSMLSGWNNVISSVFIN